MVSSWGMRLSHSPYEQMLCGYSGPRTSCSCLAAWNSRSYACYPSRAHSSLAISRMDTVPPTAPESLLVCSCWREHRSFLAQWVYSLQWMLMLMMQIGYQHHEPIVESQKDTQSLNPLLSISSHILKVKVFPFSLSLSLDFWQRDPSCFQLYNKEPLYQGSFKSKLNQTQQSFWKVFFSSIFYCWTKD